MAEDKGLGELFQEWKDNERAIQRAGIGADFEKARLRREQTVREHGPLCFCVECIPSVRIPDSWLEPEPEAERCSGTYPYHHGADEKCPKCDPDKKEESS